MTSQATVRVELTDVSLSNLRRLVDLEYDVQEKMADELRGEVVEELGNDRAESEDDPE